MNIRSLYLLGVALLASPTWAHFPFLVPTPNLESVQILLSESLELDDKVPADLVLGGTYGAQLADGRVRMLEAQRAGSSVVANLPGDLAAANLLFGTLDMGFTRRGEGTPHILVYYAKTLLREAFDPNAHVANVPIEITPVRTGGGLQLLLSVDGAPQPDTEIVVIMPDGTEREVLTGADGRSEVLRGNGRYGAWARHWIDEPGVRDGEAYDQVRRYATLVFDYESQSPVAEPAERVRGHANMPDPIAIKAATPLKLALPEATSSFGAVQERGWIYVYGGHIAPTHDYDVNAVSGRFWRIDMTGRGTWEELPSGPTLQGMNLAAHDGLIYRVGGMLPRNAPGEKVDNWSVRSAARFDPSQHRWEDLPPLPEGRSSHDVAIVDGKLYAIGGWDMHGAQGNDWLSTMLVLDLTDPRATWVEMPQPFRRRALIVAVHDHKIFVIGGFDAEDEPSRRVDVFDPREGRWLQGPGLPGSAMNGFAPAACVLDRQLYISVGDGTLHQLNDRDYRWDQVGTNTRRIVHRMLPLGGRILIVGGAAKGDNLDLIEELAPAPANALEARTASYLRESANAQVSLARSKSTQPSDQRQWARPIAAKITQPAIDPPRVTETVSISPTAEPSKPIEAAAPPSPGAVAAAMVQTHCPLMPDETVDANSYAVEYGDQTVLLCCKSCLRKWNRNPARFANSPLLPQLAQLE